MLLGAMAERPRGHGHDPAGPAPAPQDEREVSRARVVPDGRGIDREYAIERELKGRDWLAKRRAKLPASVRAMNEVVEAVDDFRARRLRWHVRDCVATGIVDPWVAMRRASLPPCYIDTVRAEFAAEMASALPGARAA
jgi:hypothetical protein